MLKSEGLPIYCVNTPFSQFLRLQLGDVWNLFKRSNGQFGKCVIGDEDDDDDDSDDEDDVGDDGDDDKRPLKSAMGVLSASGAF